MRSSWTRREFLTRAGVAVAAVQTFENLDPCCVLAADAETADKELFELKPVADGVYAAIAAPRYKVNSNAAVILTNDGVIVVDSHSKPSAAYALYREIQAITKQPIRKIINTHFHWDHWQGNQVYAEAFPDLEIITSERTRENLTQPGRRLGRHRLHREAARRVPKEIEKLKDDIVRASDAEQKARLEANLRQTEAYLEELKQLKPALPTRTLSTSITLNEGGPRNRDPATGPRPHRRRRVHLSAQGEGRRDRRCPDRLDAVHERRLSGGLDPDSQCAGEVRLRRASSPGTVKWRRGTHLAFFRGYSPISSPR